MKKTITLLLLGLLCSIGTAWGADFTYALSSFTELDHTYTYEFDENGLKNKVAWVEVPSSSSEGLITFKCSGSNSSRYLYIYKTNGTVKDDTRKVAYSSAGTGYPTAINFTSSDILTDNGKYYLVFSTTDDYKIKGVKYTLTDPSGLNITPEAGIYAGSLNVSISANTGYTIYYTDNGTTPTNLSTEYVGTFSLTNSKTIKAIAYKNNTPGFIRSASYTIVPENRIYDFTAPTTADMTALKGNSDVFSDNTSDKYVSNKNQWNNGQDYALEGSDGADISVANGLLFGRTGSNISAGSFRYYYTSEDNKLYWNNGNMYVKIPAVLSGKDIVLTMSSSSNRTVSATNCTATSASYTASDKKEITFTTNANGVVQLSVSGNCYVYSVEIKDHEIPVLTGKWTPSSGSIFQNETVPTPTFSVNASDESVLDGSEYSVTYSLKAGSTSGVITITGGGSGYTLNNTTIGTATLVATLESTDVDAYAVESSTYEYEFEVKEIVPTLSLSASSGEINIKSYETIQKSVTVTLTGSNLTEGTVITPSPSVAGVSVSPESVTVPASGVVSQEFTLTSTASTKASTIFTFAHAGAVSKMYTLSYSKASKRSLDQTDVTAATTWDWSNAGSEQVLLTVIGTDEATVDTDPVRGSDFTLSDIAEIENDGDFNSQALFVNCQYPHRINNNKHFFQGSKIVFNTTIPGSVQIWYSNTGSNGTRYVIVNGTVDTSGSTSSGNGNNRTSDVFDVSAGTVTITAKQIKNEVETLNSMLQISKVVFTPASVSGTISPAGWSTFSSPCALDLSKAVTNGTVYFASVSDGSTVTLEEAPAQVVPAGEGLMVKGTAGNTFTIQTSLGAGTAIDGNLLKGQTVTGNVSATNHYVFGYVTETPSTYGFYALTAETEVQAGKAYLEYPAAMAPSFLRIVEGEQSATSVENIEANDKAVKFIENGQLYILRDGVVYDTVGRVIRK